MKHTPMRILFLILAIGSLLAAPSYAQVTLEADLTNSLANVPFLDATPTPNEFEWSEIDAGQGQKSGFVLSYPRPDPTLTAAPTTVTVRPSATALPELCNNAPVPSPVGTADIGTCFFNVAAGTVISIIYIGNLATNEALAYTVSGIVSNQPGNFVFADFDSATPPLPVGGTLAPGAELTATTSRDPAKVVLVLDKSGSMAWSSRTTDPACTANIPAAGACLPSRWEVLGSAVEQTMQVAEHYALIDDSFAVAFFDSTASATLPFAAFDSIGLNNLDAALTTGNSPGGGTSIGSGVLEWNADLQADSGSNQAILVFTDGINNVAPALCQIGSGGGAQLAVKDVSSCELIGGTLAEVATEAAVCPFVMIAECSPDSGCTDQLQAAADMRCDGLLKADISIDPADTTLTTHLLQVLENTIVGDKIELLSVASDVLEADFDSDEDARPEGTQTFTISNEDIAFSVLLNWAESGNGISQNSILLEKDGVVFTESGRNDVIISSLGNSYRVVTMRQPFCNAGRECVAAGGDWTLRFRPFFEVAETFTYNAIVSADNRSLAHTFRVDQPAPGVGEPLTLTATLNERGQPIEGLAGSAVRALVSRPEASLNNVLSDADIRPLSSPDVDPTSAASLKAKAMLADPTLRDAYLSAVQAGLTTEVALVEGDDGVYEAQFTNTDVAGMYEVVFLIDGITPDNGRYLRHYEVTRYVPVVADDDATLGSVTQSSVDNCSAPGGCFAVTLLPVDGLGNRLGPGKVGLFALPDFDGDLLEPITDHLDGRYTIKVALANPAQGQTTLQIGGTSIALDIGAGGASTTSNLFLWILLLLIVLLIVWWIRKTF